MAKTGKQLKKVGKAIKSDVCDCAKEVKESFLETAAEAAVHVREKGGIGGVVEDAVATGAGYVGKGIGYVGKGGHALYNAVAGESEEKKAEEKKDEEDEETLADKIAEPFRYAGEKIAQGYEDSEVDPDSIGETFEDGIHTASDAVGSFFGKIKDGISSVGSSIGQYVPSMGDYKVKIGKKSYQIRKDLIKPDLEKVKTYMTDVSSAVPSRCKFREDVLKTIAEEGIKSNEEFEEKQKMLYKTIAKYMKK